MRDRREKSLKLKMKVFNDIMIAVLRYGATAWALTRTEERRLDVFEMGMLRSILVVRWEDFFSNVNISDVLCQAPVSLKFRRERTK